MSESWVSRPIRHPWRDAELIANAPDGEIIRVDDLEAEVGTFLGFGRGTISADEPTIVGGE